MGGVIPETNDTRFNRVDFDTLLNKDLSAPCIL